MKAEKGEKRTEDSKDREEGTEGRR